MNVGTWICWFRIYFGFIFIRSVVLDSHIQIIDFVSTKLVRKIQYGILAESIDNGSQLTLFIHYQEAVVYKPAVNCRFQLRLGFEDGVLQMGHIEVGKSHSEWRTHAYSVNLGVESSVAKLKWATGGASLK